MRMFLKSVSIRSAPTSTHAVNYVFIIYFAPLKYYNLFLIAIKNHFKILTTYKYIDKLNQILESMGRHSFDLLYEHGIIL